MSKPATKDGTLRKRAIQNRVVKSEEKDEGGCGGGGGSGGAGLSRKKTRREYDGWDECERGEGAFRRS